MAAEGNRLLSALQGRLLDRRHRVDYLLLLGLTLIPLVVSWQLGLHDSLEDESGRVILRGYWNAYNWSSFSLMLPTALYLLRWFMDQLYGAGHGSHPDIHPPLLLAFADSERPRVAARLQELARQGWLWGLVLGLTVLFHVGDLWDEARLYGAWLGEGRAASCNLDWESGFLLPACYQLEAGPTVRANLLLVAVAYLCQFLLVFIALMAVVLTARFNLFYLSRIYQRSRRQPEEYFILLDLDDSARSFGLRPLHQAFNLQLVMLVVAGIFVLISRYGTIPEAERLHFPDLPTELSLQALGDFLQALEPGSVFPDFGQIAMSICWIVTFVLVLLPALTKFLPFTSRTVRAGGMDAVSYLREFLSPRVEDHYPLEDDEQVSAVAEKFARNSFWPAGDDMARFFLYFAFYVLLVVLFPVGLSSPLEVILGILGLFVLAITLSHGVLKVFRFALGHVDRRLVLP